MATQPLDYDPDEKFKNDEAAAYVDLAPSTMKLNRHLGRGPKFIKLGDGKNAAVRYRRGDLDAWLAEREFSSTSEYSAAVRAPAARVSNRHPVSSSTIPAPWLRSNG